MPQKRPRGMRQTMRGAYARRSGFGIANMHSFIMISLVYIVCERQTIRNAKERKKKSHKPIFSSLRQSLPGNEHVQTPYIQMIISTTSAIRIFGTMVIQRS
jgi:hypothetical protein